MRHLVIVLGDQLDAESSALQDFDSAQDVVWMAEVDQESTHVWSAKQRIAVFLSAMRHFAERICARGMPLRYVKLDQADNQGTLALELSKAIAQLQPVKLVLTAPGDWRVLHSLRNVAKQHGLPLDLRDDTHFFSTVREFAAHADGRKQLRLEYWYRELRQKHGILMEGKAPIGGQWNFDADNRQAFGKAGPQNLPPPTRCAPDATTQEVLALVNTRFASHPGTLDRFGWPVTRPQALSALHAFIAQRLPLFGLYEDAMWEGQPWLYHSHLSCALNLKLLNPREVVHAAEAAYRAGHAPLAAAEGFIRQIVGWREYVRGIYWLHMPSYLERNALDAQAALPAWYWTGQTEMACLKDAITQTLEHGYAHHIQRLMVTGLYALLLGVKPQAVPERVCGRRGMGGTAQHAGNGAVWRRWTDGQQALRSVGKIHTAHVQPLPRLPLRPGPVHRPEGMPLHHPVLGLSHSPCRLAEEKSAHGHATEKPGTTGCRCADRHCRASRSTPPCTTLNPLWKPRWPG